LRTGESVSTLGGYLRVMEIDAAEASRQANAFDRIRAGELQAIIVHDVYRPEVLPAIIERLERNAPAFLQTWFPAKFRSWFFGRNLNLADPGLPRYFEEAEAFSAQLEKLFPDGQGLAARVGSILSALDRGRPFIAPPGPGPGQRYMFTTLRAHQEGGYIPPHFDNEQALRPSYAHLRTQTDLHMTSFVLTLDWAESGGALEVFDIRCDPALAVPISDDRSPHKPDITGLEPVSFRIPPGAMIILDSGRYLHRLSPVEGARKRWTACSFMALSRNRGAMYCWG
jgi:hypothetical protein